MLKIPFLVTRVVHGDARLLELNSERAREERLDGAPESNSSGGKRPKRQSRKRDRTGDLFS